MKSKKIAMLLAEIGFVLVALGGFYMFHKQQINPETAYIFNRNMTVNTEITASDLKKVSIPGGAIRDNFIKNPKDVIGKCVNTKVFAGEYVIGSKVVEKNDIDPFESMDKTGLRKISIETNLEQALGGNLKKGDKVDLSYVGNGAKKNQTGDNKFTYAKTFMQDIYVYNVLTDEGYMYKDKSEGKLEESEEENQDVGEVALVTLAVTPEQAEEILARQKNGQIRIIGRFEDSQNVDSNGFVLGDYDKVPTNNANAETKK